MPRFLITIALLLATAAANYSLSRPDANVPRRPLKDFPKTIGDWHMIGEQAIDEKSMEILGVDDYIMRAYSNGKGGFIEVYIGYFESQREGKQIHSPRQCLPGSGWSVLEKSEASLSVGTGRPKGGKINSFLMGKGAEKSLFLWWYQGRGRIYSSEYLNKAYLMWDRLTERRTDGALVRVHSRINPDVEHTMGELKSFINDFMPLIRAFIPD